MTLIQQYRCPECNDVLRIEHVHGKNRLALWVYRGRCDGCGWSGTLREIWCESCERTSLAVSSGGGWRCLKCGSS
jgi:hypothetical protein